MAATFDAAHGRIQAGGAVVPPVNPPPSAWVGGDGRGSDSKITIKNLDFFYGETRALKGVSLDIPNHRVTGIIGPSGCGKSTLLRVLNRIYEEYPGQRATGEVRLDGKDILGLDVDLDMLRNRVAMVFQAATVFPMSIYDNTAFGARVQETLSRAQVDERVEDLLTRAALWMEVKDRLSQPASALSGGQQQRLCIARALGTRPEVLLLDEPSGALDPRSAEAVEALIIDLKRSLSIVLVTHNLQQAKRCADQVAFLYLGNGGGRLDGAGFSSAGAVANPELHRRKIRLNPTRRRTRTRMDQRVDRKATIRPRRRPKRLAVLLCERRRGSRWLSWAVAKRQACA